MRHRKDSSAVMSKAEPSYERVCAPAQQRPYRCGNVLQWRDAGSRPRTPEFRVPHAQSGAITPEPRRGFERGANAPSRRGRIRVQVCFANSAAEQRPWIHLRISKLRKKEEGSRK